MKPDMFRQPICILIGLGFPVEVRSVMDAYDTSSNGRPH